MSDNNELRNIAVLGSTGSIGTQTLDIIAEHPERFRATVLTAGRNWRLLAEQARRFRPQTAVIADKEAFGPLREALAGTGVEVRAGDEEIAAAAAHRDVDTVVTAIVGYSGLIPTIEAIRANKTIALSNKETLVVAGELITGMLRESEARIVPVDSEHSAIFQCLMGEDRKTASKIILTASGGPFRTFSAEQLGNVTPADALRHPNWNMGAKVTVDSASMMNKGFEMIEAKWLFGCPEERIEIVVHPQSIVHSMVEFTDGSVKAQLGLPDMRIPISLALGFPERVVTSERHLHLADYANLTFEAPDYDRFPLLGLAFEAIRTGGNMPCALNAANEIAVDAFLKGRLRFVEMPRLVENTMHAVPFIPGAELPDLVATNTEARRIAASMLGQ